MASQKAITYTPGELRLGATKWLNNILNLDHEWRVLNTVGTIQNAHWSNNSVKGDLHIFKGTTAGKDTIALIDSHLVNSLSVELRSEDVRDYDSGKLLATDIDFIGCAVIYGDNGACLFAKIQE
jgi:hypothetical protein